MKTGIIVQARMGSTRLPGKILKELPFGSGISSLQQVIRRLKRSKTAEEIIIAIPVGDADDRIEEIALSEQVKCFRGSEEDVLERYFKAAEKYKLDVVVRVTGDCPCVDAGIIDLLVKRHIETGADYTSNAYVLTKSFPLGADVEVVNFSALKQACHQATEKFDREHVSEYILLNKSGNFKIESVAAKPEHFGPDIRITLDTEQDYILLCAVYDYLYPKNNFFGIADVVKLFKDKPWLKLVNSKISNKAAHKTDSLREELAEAIKVLELQELKKAGEILKTHLAK